MTIASLTDFRKAKAEKAAAAEQARLAGESEEMRLAVAEAELMIDYIEECGNPYLAYFLFMEVSQYLLIAAKSNVTSLIASLRMAGQSAREAMKHDS